jgi:hypothetical protein
MATRANVISRAKQESVRKVLQFGGDNFKWVGVGRVKVSFLGRKPPKARGQWEKLEAITASRRQ